MNIEENKSINITKEISSNNNQKLNEFEEENYLEINTKNQFDIYNIKESSKKLEEIINYVEELMEDNPNQELWQKFLDKLFPKCRREAFLISKLISKKLMKLKNINKSFIEEKINYFFSNRMEFRYSKKLILNKDNINNIGYILCYSFSKFEDLDINDKKELNNKIKEKKNINILSDFYNYCNENNKNPFDNNKLEFLESKIKEYELPGEILFLINCFEYINILEIDLNEISETKEYHESFYLFIITLLNINYLVSHTDQFKINFNNQKLQNDIYNYYNEELNSFYISHNIDLKKNKKYPKNEIYRKRWDFETDYIITKKKFLSNEEEKKDEIIKENDSILSTNYANKNSPSIESTLSFIEIDKDSDLGDSQLFDRSRKNSFIFKSTKIISSSFLRSNTHDIETSNLLSNSLNRNLSYNDNFDKNIETEKYIEIVDKNKNILELICILILGLLRLKNINNLDLVMNDSYYKEFIHSFGSVSLNSKKDKKKNNFHILDFFIKNKDKIYNRLISFNIEFNSIDFFTFYKLFTVIKQNENLNCLQISFFSSLISYSPQYIYKLYQQNKDKNEIENEIFSPDYYLLNELLSYFIENLDVLFALIKKKNLEILSLIFDIPEIILEKKRYMTTILKFILNILFLIDSRKSKIKSLKIISPKTILDSRSFSNLEELLDNIDIDKKNSTIKELTIQIQFFRINNIKNIISHNLIKLRIGEVDIYTLRELSKFLCSYNFFKNSCLQLLTIGLLNFITHFTKEIEYLLNKLFSIKIKTLKKININSNIYISSKKKFYKIIENNWIPSYSITLNEKSELSWKKQETPENNEINNKNKIIEKKKEKRILYLLHHQLEQEILTANDLNLRDKKKIDKKDSEIVWYLKYLLIFRYSKKNKDNENNINYYDQKKIIFNILKFLYYTKTTKIEIKFI